MQTSAVLLLSRCLQSCRGCAVLHSRLLSTGSSSGITDDPFNAPESEFSPPSPFEHTTSQLEELRGDSPPSSTRWFAKRHNAPQRKQMYHRRHRDQKKLEKQMDRLKHLQEIHRDAYAKGEDRLAEAAGGEAERLQRPWLQRNVPVKPPAYASVSGGTPQQAKVVTYTGSGLPKDDSLGLPTETRSMNVLNFKVGYAIDAKYALPAEVQAFVLDQSTFCLYGVDKNQVTQIASNIRRIRPPEPYKGAGIRIVGESVNIKARKVKK